MRIPIKQTKKVTCFQYIMTQNKWPHSKGEEWKKTRKDWVEQNQIHSRQTSILQLLALHLEHTKESPNGFGYLSLSSLPQEHISLLSWAATPWLQLSLANSLQSCLLLHPAVPMEMQTLSSQLHRMGFQSLLKAYLTLAHMHTLP